MHAEDHEQNLEHLVEKKKISASEISGHRFFAELRRRLPNAETLELCVNRLKRLLYIHI